MRFAFYLEDYGASFSLRELRAGNLGLGGGWARFRQLFWMAKGGHRVFLLNHYETSEVDGVNAVRLDRQEELSRAVDGVGGVDAFVFNYHGDAEIFARLRIPGARVKVMWAGNPFPKEWMSWIDGKNLHRIVCVSRFHRDSYRIYPNFHRVEMTYSGVDMDLLEPVPCGARERETVVFVGAPRKTKGFHNLLRAWPYVRRECPEARLRVLGSAYLHDRKARLGWTAILDADMEAEFLDPSLAAPRDLEGAGIELLGLLPIQRVFQELCRAEVAVVNCNWTMSFEDYCRSAVEAQACGTPVVGAARGSLPEVVRHGETGLLVDEPDPERLAGSIARLLKDDGLRESFGSAGKEWASKIGTYETTALEWEEIVQRAMEDKPAPAGGMDRRDFLRRLGYGRARILMGGCLNRMKRAKSL